MKRTVLCVLLCVALAGPALGGTPDVSYLPKVKAPAETPELESRDGGETISSAVPIPGIPFFDSGNTCGHIDDYDEACPWSSTSPDVVYSLTPEYDTCVSVSLCDSYYDTKVFVYEDYHSPGYPHECNDDNSYCYEPPTPFTSRIRTLHVFAGHTYYIVVDGYGGGCGEYELGVVTCVTMCPVECPPGGIDEGEGPCYDGYVDQFNGGCGSYPVAFSVVEPSADPIVICGKGGNFDNNTMRDTDWYLLDLTCDETTITACVEAEFPVMMGFIDMRGGCDNVSGLYSHVEGDMCVPHCLTETLPPGEWVVWVATWDWPGFPCDDEWVDYTLTIEGYETCTSVDGLEGSTIERSWSTIKGLYR